MLKSRLDADGNAVALIDDRTDETIVPYGNVVFVDDFWGADPPNFYGTPWSVAITSTSGAPTLSNLDEATGIIELALDDTNEAQSVTLGFNASGSQGFDPAQGFGFEAMINLVADVDSDSFASWGLASGSNHVIAFALDASRQLKCLIVDNSGTVELPTGLTVAIDDGGHIYRIDAADVNNIAFYVDGARQLAGTRFTYDDGNPVSPQLIVEKGSGTGAGAFDCDYVRIWQNGRGSMPT